jgi:hypothetical protein
MVHFAPTTSEVDAEGMARLFMHGLPETLVTDRDPRLTSRFWRGLQDSEGSTGDVDCVSSAN